MIEKTCNRCGRVAFGVTREYVDREVALFDEMFYSLSEEERLNNYGSIESTCRHNYEHCYACGNNYMNFRDSKEGDAPTGVTLNPILVLLN